MVSLPSATRVPRKRTAWEIQRAVLFALVLREMKQRAGGQWVGAVWTIFEPLAHMMVLVTLLGFIRGNVMPGGVEFPVFLVTGLIPYFFFQHLTVRLMDAVDANRGLFAYRQVKPFDALISRAAVETLMNLAVYTLTLGILAWIGFHVVPAFPLELMGVHLLIGCLGLASGIVAAVVSHGRPRVKSFVRIAFIPFYFITGVMFPVHTLPREYLEWLLWSPVLHLVDLSRHSFIPQYQPIEGVNLLYPLGCTLLVLTLGLALYRVKRLQLIAST